MGRDALYPDEWSLEKKTNAIDLIKRVNNLLNDLKISEVTVSSGWRPLAVNMRAGGAKRSLHMVCKAVDFKDDGTLKDAILANAHLLLDYGLWMEDPASTPTWCHLDTGIRAVRTPKVFKPQTDSKDIKALKLQELDSVILKNSEEIEEHSDYVGITVQAIDAARDFLTNLPLFIMPPEIVPDFEDGKLSLEWHNEGNSAGVFFKTKDAVLFAGAHKNGSSYHSTLPFFSDLPWQILTVLKEHFKK